MEHRAARASAAGMAAADDLFARGGEMGELMRSLDWSRTPIGPVAEWPQSLRTAVSICLASRFPILLWWGRELVMLYNDAYRQILGTVKHPRAMGQAGRECWPEIWEIIGPMLEGVLERAEATWSDDQLLLLERNGYPEECYFTFSYSPIRDEGGGIGGIFTAVTETTSKVIGERRLRTLSELAANVTLGKSADAVCSLAAQTLAENGADLPFALLYLLDEHARDEVSYARLVGVAGSAPGDALPWADRTVAPGSEGARDTWSLGEVARSGQAELIELDPANGPWPRHPVSGAAPTSALVLPIAQPGRVQASTHERPYGFLVAGINPHHVPDAEYRSFLQLVAGQIGRGIADARAYEEERRRAEALAELDRAKTTFFSNVSHEFRTPLTLMLGPIEDGLADLEQALPPRQRERQELAHRNALRLLKLVNALLDFSRIQAGRIQASYEPTDLAAYTAELASVFRSAVERAGMRLSVNCAPLDEAIYIDRDMWEKIVLNLLSNAFKYTFAGEIEVMVRPAQQAGSVELVVRDTGIGIPAEHLGHIFERFHRVEEARGRTQEGSGIGLALVQELVRLHGGTVSATSVQGAGTSFTITIPRGTAHLPADRVQPERSTARIAVDAAAYIEEALGWLPEAAGSSEQRPLDAAAATAVESRIESRIESHVSPAVDTAQFSAESPAQTGAGEPLTRILVADDNADMRAYVSRLLGATYAVESVADGAAALAAVRKQPPQLVLADVMMPGMDGFALLRAIRSDPKTSAIPVILLSARAGTEATAEGIAAGADDYVVKPFAARDLLVRVAARLEIARARRALAARARELEATLEAMADGVVVFNAEGRGAYTNSAYRRMLALDDASAFFTQPVETRATTYALRDERGTPIAPCDSPVGRVLRGELATGEHAIELRMRALDGRELEVSVSCAPIRDEAGQLIGGVAIMRDVAARRQLERRTHEALAALLEMAEVLVQGPQATGTTTDRDAQTRAMAARLAELTNTILCSAQVSIAAIDPESEVMQPLALVGLPEKLVTHWWTGWQPETTLAGRVGEEVAARLRANELVALDATQPPHRERLAGLGVHTLMIVPAQVGGRLIGGLSLGYAKRPQVENPEERALAEAVAKLVGIVIERDRLLREREEARAKAMALGEANRRMDEFLSIASHELKTPMTTMKASVQLLNRRFVRSSGPDTGGVRPDDGARSLIERAERSISRLNRLVDDLLDVSRVGSGKLELRLEPIDLRELVRDTVEQHQEANPAREIRLRLPEAAVSVRADADRIGQVLTNYLTNALKYSKSTEPIEVSLERAGEIACVCVSDRGPGIEAAELERIWDRFYRVKEIEHLSGSGVGLGLGLHISKTIVERHNGQVGVASTVGKGSSFWFSLGVIPASPAH